MDVVLVNLVKVLVVALDFYQWIVIVNVVISWLMAFNVINTSKQFVHMLMDFTYSMTEPLYRRIRSILPHMNGIDLSPIIVLLGIFLIQGILYDMTRGM